ncbi:MAG: mandelate racemase, partial [Acidobacteriia bacterium]|nr:mandelate racemase [Terriglobia bacterium]
MSAEFTISHFAVEAFTVPTATPESDGTLEWNDTTIVAVHAEAGGQRGLGYSYADVSTARLIDHALLPKLMGLDALAIGAAWQTMVRAIRNLGRPGVSSMAIAAIDSALWDLKGKLLG